MEQIQKDKREKKLSHTDKINSQTTKETINSLKTLKHKKTVNQKQFEVTKLGKIKFLYVTLGSCVGVCGYNKEKNMGFLIHMLSPKDGLENLNKLQDALEKQSLKLSDFQITIAGGNSVFQYNGGMNPGKRNLKWIQTFFKDSNIKYQIGKANKNYGIGMRLNLKDGKINYKNLSKNQ